MDLPEFEALFSQLSTFKKNRFHPLVWIVGEPEFGADEQFQLVFFGRNVRAHYPRKRAFVGDGERRVAQLGGTLDEFLRARSPAQKSEIADAMQLGIGR